jgi:hypothetical protein
MDWYERWSLFSHFTMISKRCMLTACVCSDNKGHTEAPLCSHEPSSGVRILLNEVVQI